MKSSKENKFLAVKDHLVSGESFDLIYDADLDLLKTNPFPPVEELQKYYQSEDYISHSDSSAGFMDFIYNQVKKITIKQKLNFIEKNSSQKGKILDIGTGTGDFLVEAKKREWEVFGSEPNFNARKKAEQKGISVVENFENLNGKFDVITLWHVLEHIPDLQKTIQKLSDLLDPGGTLIVAVPNYKSFDAKFYKEFWAAYDVPRHLWHFSKTSIKKMFSSDFELKTIHPMIYDSFYVSLLSEKYKTGKRLSLKALWIGWKSNWKAKRTGEFSSLMYCLKKKNGN